MSTHYDSQFDDADDELDYYESEADDRELNEWVCEYPDQCLMAYTEHMRSECYTVADAEAYYREMRDDLIWH